MRYAMTITCALLAMSGIANASEPAAIQNNPQDTAKPISRTDVTHSNRPNIVYILLDDVGFSDLGSFGSEIHTPNFDRLAAKGLRYNAFHTRAICSPSRAALLTGRNSHSVGMGNLTHVVTGAPGKQGEISTSAATVAEMLRASGYSTFAAGKWHLSPLGKPGSDKAQWPVQRGFDQYFGFIGGMTDQFHPELIIDNTVIAPPQTKGYHFTSDIVDRSIGFIQGAKARHPDQPFFLYFAPGAMHAPHQAPDAFIEKYLPIYTKGWDRIRSERFARQKKIGLIPKDTKLTDRNSDVHAWDTLSADDKKVAVRFQAAYAGFLEHTDAEIGRLLAFLDRANLADNTIIVVMSDNGASPEGEEHGTANLTYSVTNLARKFEPTSELLKHIDDIGTDRSYGNYPRGWATVSNTPFSHYKQSVDEGGLRAPLIVSWPRAIKQTGSVRPQFVDIIDITPTILDVTGTPPPTSYLGVPQKPVEGASIAPTFADAKAPSPRSVQYFELQGQRAIWLDGWKAVSAHTKGAAFEADTWKLYDQRKDFSASTDVAANNPAVLADLERHWMDEAQKYQVLPLEDVTVHNPTFFAATSGKTYRYFEPISLSMDSAPKVTNTSYRITASINRTGAETQGVILATGDRFGGYVLYVKDSLLHFEFNDFGNRTSITSSASIPVGPSKLAYEFHKTGDYTGTGTLSIDGKVVGQGRISMTPALAITFAGTDIGMDIGSPVSEAYAENGTFPFPSDQLGEVSITVE
ncbi:arylsulfatase [Caenibius tardaugens NBRC 16725]|uniref:Arylsulfatase n=1 Tax=Caenibius tardaugens NBRC 16725 TaxID=1219035 RepID=U3A8C6_9SPHN|nr:arylsulfatase [Caenibius tardaugens]AZI35334.1 arylsulfatase [Caenibius tardaugens NBRC 16725]GAD51013.1 arylsulfatase [Caenibius tardaugens NBRC 16725]